MRVGDEFKQILVAGQVFGEEPEVKEGFAVVGATVFFEARGFDKVEFAADEGFDARAFGGVIKGDGPVEIAMIGEGEGRHIQIDGPFHQAVDAAGSIKEAVIGMDVKMNEVFVSRRHRNSSQSIAWTPARANGALGSENGLYFTRGKKPLTEGGGNGLLLGFSLSDPYSHMSIEINIRKNEPIDRAIRRLKKKLERESVIKDVRAKRYFEKPCETRRRKNKVAAFTQMLRDRHAE